jgi:hypothetical protein
MNPRKVALLAASIVCIPAVFLLLDARGEDKPAVSGVTFEREVVSILQAKCQECHHPGGSAPMSLVTYGEARPWAQAIKEKVVKRVMPPFYADGPIGYYKDDIRLTEAEIKTICEWVDEGSPRGKPADHPRYMDWSAGSPAQTPDLLLRVRTPYTVKKDGIDDYECFLFNYVFPQDTWIRALDLRPSNKQAVHHEALYIVPDTLKADPDDRISGADTLMNKATLLLFSNPGGLPLLCPEGSAIIIPKGSRLGVEVHYAPSTRDGVVDQPSVGIYYANGVVNRMLRLLYGDQTKIDIPPGEKSYRSVVYKKLKTDAIINGFAAHMHLRGKSFTIRLIYPDGRQETVFALPQFYFNWQRPYHLAKPLAVPKGTVVEYMAEWDNSLQNPFNPDPNQEVHFGPKTSDEMMGGGVSYLIPEEDLGARIKDGVRIGDAGRPAVGINR